MHVVELERSLRQLHLSGMAAVIETRLRQAQAETMAPIDLIACLVSDELTLRADRLLQRRRKQAGFRDPDKTLDNFDFGFNPKMNRSLVFDLATGAFIAKHEDALFLGPGGTGKSHLAQAIGQAAILQGYKVLYREVHVLLDELADAAAEGTRKDYMQWVGTVPLLVLDDFGMRKLPHTAAEDLLEIVMRRYERFSTLLTSNRPVEDWGKAPWRCGRRQLHARSSAAPWPRAQMWSAQLAHQNCNRVINRKGLLYCEGAALALPGFIALRPECCALVSKGRVDSPPPFRLLRRRSGRIPALPYPPRRCVQYIETNQTST